MRCYGGNLAKLWQGVLKDRKPTKSHNPVSPQWYIMCKHMFKQIQPTTYMYNIYIYIYVQDLTCNTDLDICWGQCPSAKSHTGNPLVGVSSWKASQNTLPYACLHHGCTAMVYIYIYIYIYTYIHTYTFIFCISTLKCTKHNLSASARVARCGTGCCAAISQREVTQHAAVRSSANTLPSRAVLCVVAQNAHRTIR